VTCVPPLTLIEILLMMALFVAPIILLVMMDEI
jgi:hypothetical protein